MDEYVQSLPEMPTRWQIWRGAVMWVLWCGALVLVLSIGIHLYAVTFTTHTFLSATTLPFLAELSGMTILAGVLVALLNSYDHSERKKLASGRANRMTLNYLATYPSALLAQQKLSPLWEEAVKRIREKEARERAEAARKQRVLALLSAVPDTIVDYRGDTLRWYLGELLTALDAFVSDEHALQEVGFERFHLLYQRVILAIGRQLAEYAGLELVVNPPYLSQGGRRFLNLKEFLEMSPLSGDMQVSGDSPAKLRQAIAYVLTDRE